MTMFIKFISQRQENTRIYAFGGLMISRFLILRISKLSKNQFLGEEAEAIQVYPKVSNYIDNSNTYHLFSWEGMEVPNLKELYSYM